jgi:hypothetical protein
MHVNAECGGALLSQVKDPGASTEDKGLSCYGVATPARFCPETPTGAGRAVAAKASARLLFGAADRVTPTLPLKALGASSTRPAARGGGAGSTQHAWLSSDGEPAQSEYEKRIAWLQQAQIAPDCKTEGRPARPMAASEPRAAVLRDVSLAVTFRARLLPAFYITCFFDAVLVAYARRAAHSHWQNCKATGSDGNIDGGRGA